MVKYTATVVIEADSITDAWDRLIEDLPHDFRTPFNPSILTFSISGGGKRISAGYEGQHVGGVTYPPGVRAVSESDPEDRKLPRKWAR